MADEWREVGAGSDETWDQEQPVQGLLIAKKTDVGPNNSMVYIIEQPGGSRISIWGSTVLDTKFEQVPIGAEVRVEFLGKVKSPTPGRSPYKDYKVLIRQHHETLFPEAD